MISHEVTGAIARIEAHRQEMEKETGAAMACNEALRKLHELLDHEREALQSHGPGSEHGANVEAVTAAIERVKQLAGAAGKGVMPKHGRPQTQKHVGPSQPHNPPRNKGRRTMGRTSGR
jgi:bacterioferritin-associated ferredoxin